MYVNYFTPLTEYKLPTFIKDSLIFLTIVYSFVVVVS